MSRATRETSTFMRRAIPRHLTAVLAVVVTAVLALTVDAASRPAAAPAAPAPAQVATTLAPSAPAPTAEAPGSTPASTPVTDAAVGGNSSTTTVGDSTADRRIRRIVLILCGLALVVLITTVMFWRATQPVPKSLERLRSFGTRSERRRAASAAAGLPPPEAVGPEPASDLSDHEAPVLSDPLVASQAVGLVEAPPSRPGASLPADG